MHLDATTYNDISVFHQEEEFSIFHKLNFTRTVYGKEWLRHFFSEPHHDLKRILGTQKIIRTLNEHLSDWPNEITNGTLLVVEKYLDYNVDPLPSEPNAFNTWSYKTFHLEDYRMVKYSVSHCADFFRGLRKLVGLFSQQELPAFFKIYKPTTVSTNNILYKCGWSPFEGFEFPAAITHSFVNGRMVYGNGNWDESVTGMRLQFDR